MALFNLTDIKFKKDQDRGPLNSIVSSQYQTNILKYPIDIGTSYDKGHYMVLHINEQENTAQDFRRGEASGVKPNIIQISEEIQKRRGATNAVQLVPGIISGATDLAKSAADSDLVKKFISSENLKAIQQGASSIQDSLKNVTGFRRIKRTTDSIALYMPDTLGFSNSQGYSDVSVFDQLGILGTGLSAISSAVDQSNQQGQNPNLTTNLTAFALQAVRDLSLFGAGNIAGLGLAAIGVASNPGLELLYTSPGFRSFRFSFIFYPRSSAEGKQVISIIRKLQFHQAPEIVSRAGGRFLVPPSEFDIEFYYNGHENPNIPKISTCVLETIDVDYAPNGFAAYEIPGENIATRGQTGMPVAIRMDLQFKETQIITKEFLSVTNQLADEGDFSYSGFAGFSQEGE
jgi:hypothetical protein